LNRLIVLPPYQGMVVRTVKRLLLTAMNIVLKIMMIPVMMMRITSLMITFLEM
jgi:ABC-type uncharacterized transport system permease subunit